MKSVLVYFFLFLSFSDDGLLGLSRFSSNSCPNVLIKNGKIRRRPRGKFVKFVCSTGYLLAGQRISTCIHGKWDPPPPKCVRPTCMNRVYPPPNGLIYPSHSGAALHFFCKSGYELKGPTDVYCDGMKWDNNTPICLEVNTKPKLFCDFEAEDICSWTHDLNHDFDWKRENYGTPSGSIGTGPSFDHTKGHGKDGYYMYIESSSRNENDTARLISPIFEKTEAETCLEFFYHMYGVTTGTLRVYLKKISESWALNPSNAVFSKTGNQGDRWYRFYHSLGVIGEEYQIVIEGVRGPGYVSDIAIDDVRVIENCVYEEDMFSTTTDVPYSTEALLTVESCENRCGYKAFGNETHQITCDCDESCYLNSTCCPDYLDFCFTVSTTEDYYTSPDVRNEITSLKATQNRTITKATPVQQSIQTPTTVQTTAISKTTEKPTVRKTTPKNTRQTTTKPTVRITTLKSIRQTTTKPTVRITAPKTTSKTTSKPALRITTPKYIPTTRKSIPIFPTVHILMPPTTLEIVRKLLLTVSNPNVSYVKPHTTTPRKETDDSDVEEVPMQKNNDEQLLLTSPLPYRKEDASEEHWPDEVENHIDATLMKNFSESDKLLSQTMPESGDYNVVLIVISVVGICVLTTVITVFIIRRYRFSRQRMSYSNGDSQSDVRFLTSDEMLDFSLDKGYDDL